MGVQSGEIKKEGAAIIKIVHLSCLSFCPPTISQSLYIEVFVLPPLLVSHLVLSSSQDFKTSSIESYLLRLLFSSLWEERFQQTRDCVISN